MCMGKIIEIENLCLSEENFGGLWLYLKNATFEFYADNDDYDFAVNFDNLTHEQLRAFAEGIISYVEGDTSIE